MKTDFDYRIKLIGHCSLDKDSLLERFIREGASGLTNLKGEHVIVIQNKDECYIVTSAYGACQYYYTIYRNEFFHDETVIGVLGKSRLQWSWNWKALADLTQLEHVLGNDTLHPQIHRVPAASILHFRDGDLKISSLSWDELNPSFPADPHMALDAFNDATRQWLGDNVALSLSGGFDSRVVLSSLLKHGCKPLIFTMGSEDSTDVIISRQITSALGLQLSVTALRLEDYLMQGKVVVVLTNGTQTALHWHDYLHIQKIKPGSGCIFFVGVNGEFARSYYLDKGIIAEMANMASPLSLLYFWKRSLKPIFKREELSGLGEEFSKEFTQDNQCDRINRVINLCHGKLLSGLDRFYLEQRLRNFFGNVFKLYSEDVSWRAPFLNRKWTNAIWNLKRHWRFGSNWHRFAIVKNYPKLLDFPEPGKADKMYCNAPLLYWHPIRKRYKIVNYVRYPELFKSDKISEFIIGNASILSELIKINTVISIVKEHKKEGSRTRAVAFILTMIFWLMNLNEINNE